MSLNLFHPAVANWFSKQFAAPTTPQEQAWPSIKDRRHTLIAAPTGSGKTLSAFLAAIDDLVRLALAGSLEDNTHVVYVSPLKALSNDIQKNLQEPLAGIQQELRALGLDEINIRTMVRTGDTPAHERTAMIKRPPHIIVTTPESLYILLTSEGGRRMLQTARTLIVDEIHAMVGDKRGSHLALSIERLQALVGDDLVRIGLSATQKPIEEVARFLVGTQNIDKNGTPNCTIIDSGHKREIDLSVEVPGSPLGAVMSGEVFDEVYDRLAQLIATHRTTLVFVNTRRMAERVARYLGERIGDENVTSHHGSLAREQRLVAEQRLKAGELKALVATASLELGIDIGDIDLVCQLGSTRAIATLLQRVGRSGHSVTGFPKGRIFPTTRDELIECAALLDSIRRGELDQLHIPEKPLDILAQQIVASVASDEWTEDELFETIRRAYPYRGLERSEFDVIVGMLRDGFATRRGRRGAYLHHDMINHRLRGRKGARLTAITSGGAIPDTADYTVVLEPTDAVIGTVNEDWAIESMQGDIFQLGNASWEILRVENGRVRVADAHGKPPSIPFWLGEAPSRTHELSASVSRFRTELSGRFAGDDGEAAGSALAWLTDEIGLSSAAGEQIVEYLVTAKIALGVMPSQETLVIERFFDESGSQQMVIHSPFGSRLNRAWGLALRKRFCRKFNFELQAAATEDAIVLSLGATHSFALDEVFRYLRSSSVRGLLTQALLAAPMWEIRWRWNTTRALAVARRRGGKKIPAQLQRMDADDLLSAVFPDQVACAENLPGGDIEIPDHPLVNQTVRDCLEEAMDIDGLEALLASIERGEKTLIARDVVEASPLAQEILNARPYAFLDDAPLEERRTRAVSGRRWLDPETASDLGALDLAAIERVREEVWPQVDRADELHDALVELGFVTPREGRDWEQFLDELAADRRAAVYHTSAGGPDLWVAAERLPQLNAVFPTALTEPPIIAPAALAEAIWRSESALVEIIRGRLEGLGPVTAQGLADSLGLKLALIDEALVNLEVEGFVFRGRFTPGLQETEWCARRLLARIHSYTLNRLRQEIEPVSSADFIRFLLAWHKLAPDHQVEGPDAVAALIDQLEGFEAPAAAWEGEIFPSRVSDYDPVALDSLCLSGRVMWVRLTTPKPGPERLKSSGPVRTTPIALLNRKSLSLWAPLFPQPAIDEINLTSAAASVYEYLVQRGASFFTDLVDGVALLGTQIEDALGELVACGLVTADSFTGLRALLTPSNKRTNSAMKRRRREAIYEMANAGRWSLLSRESKPSNGRVSYDREAVEKIARILLRRYGVVFKRVLDREDVALPWRELLRTYHRLEARGEIRGGRFISGFSGEQFALPEAVGMLRAIRRTPGEGTLVSVSAADPLNLVGIITPGDRVSAFAANRILYRDGVPIATLESGGVRFLVEMDSASEWKAKNALVRRAIAPPLRSYLSRPA
ncbi:MAG TPA: DEAD/DEAH box helicase [Blastocatellia bacterium]|nr:DEAD/DEAH box helicase [Blastocatellia bacterium]